MKKIVCSIILIIGITAVKANELPSKVKSVTIYPNKAQVEREASFQLGPGSHTIELKGISPFIDPATIQVKASGGIMIVDSRFKTEYPVPETRGPLDELPKEIKREISLLEDSINRKEYKLAEIKLDLELINAQKNMISENGLIKGNGKVNDSIELLKEAVEFYAIKMGEIKKNELRTQQMLKKVSEELNTMQKRLNDLRNYTLMTGENKIQHPEHKIVLRIICEKPSSGKLFVNYLVNNAGWTTSYDLIHESNSEHIKMNFKAEVYQNTEEAWDQVNLTLSTNNPSLNKVKPELIPWFVQYRSYEQQLRYSRQAPASSVARGSEALSEKSIKSLESEDDSEIINYQTMADFSTRIDQMIHADYKIQMKYTLVSGDDASTVLIASEELETQFKHYVVPKIDKKAYLTAEIWDWGKLQLLTGSANIYFDGAFIGKTNINPELMEDTLRISLGHDQGIVVERNLIKENNKEKIIGEDKVKTYEYVIQYKNQKTTPINLVVQDQIPVSRVNDIVVNIEKTDNAKVNDYTGILEWRKDLKPSASGKITFSYSLKYNKNRDISMY